MVGLAGTAGNIEKFMLDHFYIYSGVVVLFFFLFYFILSENSTIDVCVMDICRTKTFNISFVSLQWFPLVRINERVRVSMTFLHKHDVITFSSNNYV